MATKKNKKKTETQPKTQAQTQTKPKPVIAVPGKIEIDDGAGGTLEVTIKLYGISDAVKDELHMEDVPNFRSAKEARAAISARRKELRAVPSEVRILKAKNNLAKRIIPQVERMVELFTDEAVGNLLVQALPYLKAAVEEANDSE